MEGYGLMAGNEEDLELGEGGGSEQEIGVVDRGEDDDETGEAWDDIGGTENGDGDVGKATTQPAEAE